MSEVGARAVELSPQSRCCLGDGLLSPQAQLSCLPNGGEYSIVQSRVSVSPSPEVDPTCLA